MPIKEFRGSVDKEPCIPCETDGLRGRPSLVARPGPRSRYLSMTQNSFRCVCGRAGRVAVLIALVITAACTSTHSSVNDATSDEPWLKPTPRLRLQIEDEGSGARLAVDPKALERELGS